ncbi:MAG: 4-(cytidine 5'-diphospho)-2-C-methyl-D-erythritol kinase [Hyphomicrobiaceae bacterium]|nr:4-(cytidine 5'-diphospho)-2-C-methyl-D-erythritol kinase [Hyphomicrobiaceae bacterium]
MLIEELARAKVNFTLQVSGRRPDGYHALASVVAFASAADVVTLDTGRPHAIEVTGPFAPKLASEYLIERTLKTLQSRHPALTLGAVYLDKRLPVAAGIGGGSADAAAVLRAVRRANPELQAAVDWHGIAATLGADVPVCLANEPTFMTGIGDVLQTMPRLHEPIAAVLVNPQAIVPADKTAQVFRTLRAPDLAAEASDMPSPPHMGSISEVIDAIARLGNDLEAPATVVMPIIADVLAALRSTPGCRTTCMSGAGPTCFAIFDDAAAAAAAASSLRHAQAGWWVEAVTLS